MTSVNICEKVFNTKPTKKSPRKKINPAERFTKEQLAWALRRKKECDSKALNVVKELLEPNIEENEFLGKLNDINQSYYQDITEERAITKLCGYPLCNEKIPEMPKKQFHISLHSNKVYDLTDRKNFCSNNCFKASNYIKEQILTGPLWLRYQEEIPDFHVLYSQKKTPTQKLSSKKNESKIEDSFAKMLIKEKEMFAEKIPSSMDILKSQDNAPGNSNQSKQTVDKSEKKGKTVRFNDHVTIKEMHMASSTSCSNATIKSEKTNFKSKQRPQMLREISDAIMRDVIERPDPDLEPIQQETCECL